MFNEEQQKILVKLNHFKTHKEVEKKTVENFLMKRTVGYNVYLCLGRKPLLFTKD